jgi:precorrin-8X/cobalt-precorrin-8 methylmutase
MDYMRPAQIERESMAIIEYELNTRGYVLSEETKALVMRVIHTTADFDYAENLRFTSNAMRLAQTALRGGTIITDSNMALAGISRPALQKLGCSTYCYMAEPLIAQTAKERGVTRAVASMDHAADLFPGAVYAIGNAPTALLRLTEYIEEGMRPALVIGVPVGFVNVTESKERALAVCEKYGVPAVIALGNKGGSTVAAAICNALLYQAADLTAPESRAIL